MKNLINFQISLTICHGSVSNSYIIPSYVDMSILISLSNLLMQHFIEIILFAISFYAVELYYIISMKISIAYQV